MNKIPLTAGAFALVVVKRLHDKCCLLMVIIPAIRIY